MAENPIDLLDSVLQRMKTYEAEGVEAESFYIQISYSDGKFEAGATGSESKVLNCLYQALTAEDSGINEEGIKILTEALYKKVNKITS